MSSGQITYLAPDGANLVGLTAVEADAFVKDATAHSVAHHVVIVALHLGVLLFHLLFAQVGMSSVVSLLEVGQNLVESFLAGVLLQRLLGNVISLGIELGVHLRTQVFVVHLVAVFALHVGAQLLRELGLQLAHGLDSSHGSLQGANHVLLAHLFHLAFHHHDVLG